MFDACLSGDSLPPWLFPLVTFLHLLFRPQRRFVCSILYPLAASFLIMGPKRNGDGPEVQEQQ